MEFFGYNEMTILASGLRALHRVMGHYEYLLNFRFILNLFPLIFILSIQPFKTLLSITDPFFGIFRAITPKVGNSDFSLVVGCTTFRAFRMFIEIVSKTL